MKRKIFAGLLVLMLLALTACGGSDKSAANTAMADMQMESTAAESMDMEYGGGTAYADNGGSSAYSEGRKMIRTASLELETTEFEESVTALADLTERFEGYFESSSIGNRGSGYRWADYTVRVPAARYQEFLNQAGTLCHETWRSTSEEDVSEAYYDTEGRLKTQQIKLERLQALLAKAEAMEDIITIESAISETEQAIDSLSGTLRHYDGLVDYATVSVTLSEVYKLSNVEEKPIGFGGRLAAAFSEGGSAFLNGMEDLTVALAYGWLWIILLAVIAVAVVRLLRRRRKRVLPEQEKKPGQDQP